MADLSEEVEVVAAAALGGVPHGFLGRRGGVSTGELAGLNVGHGSGDDPALIRENRRRAAEAVLPGARLLSVFQVHSSDCVVADAAGWPDDSRPHADALVTDRPGTLLGILTADCTPVLFADQEAGVIGAAHAGWKGAIGGVTDSTVAAMERLGAKAERIVAAIGPCIAQQSYEVDESFRDRFLATHPANTEFFLPGRVGHYQFDLEGYVAARLRAVGVGRVETLAEDTYAQPERFYSFRRATHQGEAGYGRQFSLIGLR